MGFLKKQTLITVKNTTVRTFITTAFTVNTICSFKVNLRKNTTGLLSAIFLRLKQMY